MRIEKGIIVPLGYGKFFRSDSIVGIEPIEENRGPGKRARVYVHGVDSPVVASRSETAILRDLVGLHREELKTQEQHQLLADVLDAIRQINPVLRSIVRDQGKWDLDRLEERLNDILGDEEK